MAVLRTFRCLTPTAPAGIEVRAPGESAQDVLAGIARDQDEFRLSPINAVIGPATLARRRPQPSADALQGDA